MDVWLVGLFGSAVVVASVPGEGEAPVSPVATGVWATDAAASVVLLALVADGVEAGLVSPVPALVVEAVSALACVPPSDGVVEAMPV